MTGVGYLALTSPWSTCSVGILGARTGVLSVDSGSPKGDVVSSELLGFAKTRLY